MFLSLDLTKFVEVRRANIMIKIAGILEGNHGSGDDVFMTLPC